MSIGTVGGLGVRVRVRVGSDRREDRGGFFAWFDRGAQRRERVRQKHADVGASPGVRSGR